MQIQDLQDISLTDQIALAALASGVLVPMVTGVLVPTYIATSVMAKMDKDKEQENAQRARERAEEKVEQKREKLLIAVGIGAFLMTVLSKLG